LPEAPEKGRMKKAEIYATAAGGTPGYVWNWRCRETGAGSATSFPLYFDCVADAREKGYEVELTQASGLSAPGGAGFALGKRDRN
jgi:hypothetical protein